MQKCLLIIGLLIGFTVAAIAQKPEIPVKKSKADSTQAKHDSLRSKPFVPKITGEKIYHPDSNHSPHLAVIRSLFVPGWGQIYNHKWWKVPLVYAGLGGFAVFFVKNQGYFDEDLAIAKYREKGTVPNPGDKYYNTYILYQTYNVTDQAVNDQVRADERNRDLCIFGFLGMWALQTIDAYIDAKFMHSYSMDNNFTFKVTPGIINPPVYAQNFNGSIIPGLKLTFTLK